MPVARFAMACACLFAIATGSLLAQPAMPQLILIGPDLQPRRVTIQGLRDGVITYFDDTRELRAHRLDQFVQLRKIESSAAATAPSGTTAKPDLHQIWVELNDGQRLQCHWEKVADDGQSLSLRHAAIGSFTISLEQVRTITRDPTLFARADHTSDRIVMDNGDVIEGFVTAVIAANATTAPGVSLVPAGQREPINIMDNGDVIEGFVTAVIAANATTAPGVSLVPTGQREPINIALAHMRSIELANPVQRAAGAGHMIWLSDGSRLLARDLVIDGQKLAILPRLGELRDAIAVPFGSMQRVELDNAQGALIDLSSLTPSQVSGGDVFGLPIPPRVTEQWIRLHAPVTVRYELPPGTRRLAMTLELADDPDTTQTNRDWADMQLLVSVDGETLGRYTISASHPRTDVILPLRGRALQLELDPAANGPIMDRLNLRDAVLFVQRARE